MIKCHYCQTYKIVPESLRRLVMEAPKRKISHRYCREVQKEVTTESIACDKFTPTDLFWCDRWSEWVHIIVCINHHNNKKLGCVTCSQYKQEVSDVARGRDLYRILGIERKNNINGNHNGGS